MGQTNWYSRNSPAFSSVKKFKSSVGSHRHVNFCRAILNSSWFEHLTTMFVSYKKHSYMKIVSLSTLALKGITNGLGRNFNPKKSIEQQS